MEGKDDKVKGEKAPQDRAGRCSREVLRDRSLASDQGCFPTVCGGQCLFLNHAGSKAQGDVQGQKAQRQDSGEQ